MRYDFAKLNGIGNDFVMIEDLDDEILLTPEQITALCDRHFGIGGDGVIIVKPSPRPECAAYMDYYNLMEPGRKCAATAYAASRSSSSIAESSIPRPAASSLTRSPPQAHQLTLDTDGKLAQATVDMGAPHTGAGAGPDDVWRNRDPIRPCRARCRFLHRRSCASIHLRIHGQSPCRDLRRQEGARARRSARPACRELRGVSRRDERRIRPC